MLQLQIGSSWSHRYTLETATAFRLEGASVCSSSGRPALLRLGYAWQVHRTLLRRLDLCGAAMVRFENERGEASRGLGPYEALAIIDGCLYNGETLLGRFDDLEERWCLQGACGQWATLVVSSTDAH